MKSLKTTLPYIKFYDLRDYSYLNQFLVQVSMDFKGVVPTPFPAGVAFAVNPLEPAVSEVQGGSDGLVWNGNRPWIGF